MRGFILFFLAGLTVATVQATEAPQLKIQSFKKDDIVNAERFGDVLLYVTVEQKVARTHELQELIDSMTETNKKIGINQEFNADFFKIKVNKVMIPSNSRIVTYTDFEYFLKNGNNNEEETSKNQYSSPKNQYSIDSKYPLRMRNIDSDTMNQLTNIIKIMLIVDQAFIIYGKNTEPVLGQGALLSITADIPGFDHDRIIRTQKAYIVSPNLYPRVLDIPFVMAYPDGIWP